MKIALCSTFVPFVYGGYRNIVEWLQLALEQQGHQVERIYLPELDSPDLLFRQMAAFRWVDLESADRLICFRPQAHLIPHSHKILWFIHHLRAYYDLWDTPFGISNNAQNRKFREALVAADNNAFQEAKSIFSNSNVVSKRLKEFNGINSEVLYPPVFEPSRFYCGADNDEIVCISRMEHHKRQHLLIEALPFTKTDVRLRLCGDSSSFFYQDHLRDLITQHNLQDRVLLEDRWITEQDKVDRLASCLAAAYIPFDEDSYGYPSLEAGHSQKPILTTSDAGGVLELVEDGMNGFVTEPSPQALAEAMDNLYLDRNLARLMGRNSFTRISELNISWSHVVSRLLT